MNSRDERIQQNPNQEVEPLDGERGIPNVNSKGRSKGAKIAIVLIIALLFMALVVMVVLKSRSKSGEAAKQREVQQASAVPARTFATTPPPIPRAVPPPQPVPVVPPPVPGQAPPLPGDLDKEIAARKAVLDKSSSALAVVSSESKPFDIGEDGTDESENDGQGGPLSGLLSGTKTAKRKASNIGDRNFLLAKGAFIDCGLQTRLDSTVPGMTSCVVTRDIFSDNGKVLLVERGSTVTGEYQSNLKQGQARIYVLWTRIKTPNGVVVNLDSPGADALGGAGVPGHVNNHFWKRFGGAMMLSLVDDVARFAVRNSGGQGQISFNSTGDATTDMASVALQNTINIPPTLYKNQGDQVGIYIARDLDFSEVYDVRAQ